MFELIHCFSIVIHVKQARENFIHNSTGIK